MKANEFIQVERDFNRVKSAVRLLCDERLVPSLNRIDMILCEVRHHAVAVEDIRKTVTNKAERAELLAEAGNRLLSFLTPSKFDHNPRRSL